MYLQENGKQWKENGKRKTTLYSPNNSVQRTIPLFLYLSHSILLLLFSESVELPPFLGSSFENHYFIFIHKTPIEYAGIIG